MRVSIGLGCLLNRWSVGVWYVLLVCIFVVIVKKNILWGSIVMSYWWGRGYGWMGSLIDGGEDN